MLERLFSNRTAYRQLQHAAQSGLQDGISNESAGLKDLDTNQFETRNRAAAASRAATVAARRITFRTILQMAAALSGWPSAPGPLALSSVDHAHCQRAIHLCIRRLCVAGGKTPVDPCEVVSGTPPRSIHFGNDLAILNGEFGLLAQRDIGVNVARRSQRRLQSLAPPPPLVVVDRRCVELRSVRVGKRVQFWFAEQRRRDAFKIMTKPVRIAFHPGGEEFGNSGGFPAGRPAGLDPTSEKIFDEHSKIATGVVHLVRLLMAGRNKRREKARRAVRSLAISSPTRSARRCPASPSVWLWPYSSVAPLTSPRREE